MVAPWGAAGLVRLMALLLLNPNLPLLHRYFQHDGVRRKLITGTKVTLVTRTL